jgi:hypothetical protein
MTVGMLPADCPTCGRRTLHEASEVEGSAVKLTFRCRECGGVQEGQRLPLSVLFNEPVEHACVKLDPENCFRCALNVDEIVDDFSEQLQTVRGPDDLKCQRCGAALTDDDGVAWPYCVRCGWCPDCGVTHQETPDRRGEQQ